MYDWFEEMNRIREQMERMFQSNFLPSREIVPSKSFRVPNCNVFETEKSVIADIELPGVEKEDIQLNVLEQAFEIKVEKKKEVEKKTENQFLYRSASRSYYRYIPLPKKIIPEKTTAEFKNGLLRITAQKAEQGSKKGRKIQIK